MKRTKRWLWDRIGGLSHPSKMPGYGWSISAKRCITGGKLHRIEGTVCHNCYALKGRYVFPTVIAAQERRLRRYTALGSEMWTSHMADLLNRVVVRHPYFRWFDAGDLQSPQMFRDIISVARCTPTMKHWLPTREREFVLDVVRDNAWRIPQNLCVRISDTMVGVHVPLTVEMLHYGLAGSMVHTDPGQIPPHGFECPAPSHGGTCDHPTQHYRHCRACWGRSTILTSYVEH